MAIEAVTCGCGHVLWGDALEELLEDADRHVRSAHPELVHTLSPLELARPQRDEHAAAA
jgi:hypothetical protein